LFEVSGLRRLPNISDAYGILSAQKVGTEALASLTSLGDHWDEIRHVEVIQEDMKGESTVVEDAYDVQNGRRKVNWKSVLKLQTGNRIVGVKLVTPQYAHELTNVYLDLGSLVRVARRWSLTR